MSAARPLSPAARLAYRVLLLLDVVLVAVPLYMTAELIAAATGRRPFGTLPDQAERDVNALDAHLGDGDPFPEWLGLGAARVLERYDRALDRLDPDQHRRRSR
ncbi:hypothetical protein [Streptomyces antibioticus]|uniref:hypothetical protein n=1 Tax=Streptomyces antibioticus TaxID=1890 RepID=UPI003D756F04